jgi:Zn-dependent peptidase ImmA (M78 family)
MILDNRFQADFDADTVAAANEPRRKLARDLARALIKKFQIKTPPVDVESIVRARGLTLVKVDTESTLSGALYVKVKEIVINTRGRSEARQRFTIAHELGHWEFRHHELGELPPDTLGYAGGYDADGQPEPRSAVEVEANAFAAELLMPSTWIRKIQKPLPTGLPQTLADQYQVSKEAMFYQLMSCGRF